MHVLARLAGHGVTVVPHVPFSFERHGGRGGDAVVVTHRPQGGLPRRLVLIPAPGGCRLEPAAAAATAEVAELRPGPAEARWRIQTSRFGMDWPEGFALQSSPAPERPPGFDLVAPGGLLLFPQGPFDAGHADGEALVGPGQRVVARGEAGGSRFVEVSYLLEHTPWRQRHLVVPLGEARLVVTLQAPEASADTPPWVAAIDAASSVRSV